MVRLLDVAVFKNPFSEYKEKLEKRLAKEQTARDGQGEKDRLKREREKDRTNWFGADLGEKAKATGKELSTAGLGGVGKYLAAATSASGKRALPVGSESMLSAEPEAPKKKRKGGFGDFSAW